MVESRDRMDFFYLIYGTTINKNKELLRNTMSLF